MRLWILCGASLTPIHFEALNTGTHNPRALPWRIYDLARMLSLDVALGALGSGWMAACYLKVTMPLAWYVLLPLAVWVAYTLDHLMDARRIGAAASTPRHRFHHDRFGALAVLVGMAGIAGLVSAVIWLEMRAVYFGLGLGAVAGLHFLLVRLVGSRTSPFLIKELGVALVYTAGTWGLPLMMADHWDPSLIGIPVGQFLLLALVNLLELSLYEADTDARDRQTSLVQAIGRAGGLRLVRLLLAMAAGLGVLPLLVSDATELLRLEMVFAIMSGLLAAIILRPNWFMRNERYRAWADAAFLLPYIYVLIAQL